MTGCFAPSRLAALLLAVGLALAGRGEAAADAATASPWHDGYNSRVRLVATTVERGGGRQVVLGVELELAEGWKTYWRNPGDSGGVPPNFEWKASENLKHAEVRFPAPSRLDDKSGDAIGYKKHVIFPIAIAAGDPSKPIEVKLALEYGICLDICVPAEAMLELVVPPDGRGLAPHAGVAEAVGRVPRLERERIASDPKVVRKAATLTGEKPALDLEVEFPGGPAGADVFIDGPEGVYVPQPKRVGDAAGKVVKFRVALDSGVDPKDLAGKELKLTMVSAAGASEATWQLD